MGIFMPVHTRVLSSEFIVKIAVLEWGGVVREDDDLRKKEA